MSGLVSRNFQQKLFTRIVAHARHRRTLGSSRRVLNASDATSDAAPTAETPATTAAEEAWDASEASVDDALPPLPQYVLPREKMRALVELYHNAEDFITYENLDKRIDEAFTGAKSFAIEDSYQHLIRQLESREQMPDFVRVSTSGARKAGLGTSWSNSISTPERVERVRAALWGTTRDGRPDLEMVEEEMAEVDRAEATEEAMYGPQ
ncbi:hypothetical protein EXIGLDRAFT_758271 [Exidia glandulosa HHB12029]|uniref:Uncharacterized protein n=1 Tax=Exidia glandulosa HHB12029 TaxID=1314781 RepID=A0A166BTR6_EXIGL|nr:hypothetical protein EXIGLDRAFT_758271 [Exidia glandulosa HHB12029]